MMPNMSSLKDKFSSKHFTTCARCICLKFMKCPNFCHENVIMNTQCTNEANTRIYQHMMGFLSLTSNSIDLVIQHTEEEYPHTYNDS